MYKAATNSEDRRPGRTTGRARKRDRHLKSSDRSKKKRKGQHRLFATVAPAEYIAEIRAAASRGIARVGEEGECIEPFDELGSTEGEPIPSARTIDAVCPVEEFDYGTDREAAKRIIDLYLSDSFSTDGPIPLRDLARGLGCSESTARNLCERYKSLLVRHGIIIAKD